MKLILRILFYKLNDKLKIILLNFNFWINKINNKVNQLDNCYFIKGKNKIIFFSIPNRLLLFRKGLEFRLFFLKKKYFLSNLKFKKNDIIIDCGANIGELYFCFPKKLNINYIAYEPSPIVYKDLCRNTHSTKAKLFNIALHDKKLKKKFYLLDEYADSSLIKIKNFKKTILVNCITLDSIIKKINKRIKLIKIDSEGSEPEVLKGLKKLYYKVDYISVECGPERGINQTSTFNDCYKILKKKNFFLINSNNTQNTFLFKNKILL